MRAIQCSPVVPVRSATEIQGMGSTHQAHLERLGMVDGDADATGGCAVSSMASIARVHSACKEGGMIEREPDGQSVSAGLD